MKSVLKLVAIILFSTFSFIFSDDSFVNYFGLQVLGSTALEAKAILFNQSVISKDFGTIEIKPSFELSPVSVNLCGDLVYSLPLPVLQFMVGASIGSGWFLPGLNISGLGTHNGSISNTYNSENLSSFILKWKVGGAFQFDLAALVPGDWNHIQFRTYHEIYHRTKIGTPDNVLWEFEGGKDNMNGFRYYANYFLGYQMPLFISRVGLLLQTDTDITHSTNSPMNPGNWGSDFVYMQPGAVVSFKINDKFNIDVATIFHNKRNWTAATKDLSLMNRVLDNPTTIWAFNKVAFIFNFKF